MRLIDADALSGPIKLLEESYRRCGAIERAEAYANCLWEIEQAPTVSDWVSVKDRMPEKNGRYLCRYEQEVYGEVCRCTDFGMYDSDIGENGGWLVGKVTHWMPLPAKPKEESND